MLKFQDNNTTIIATFEYFILTTYVIIDELYHPFALQKLPDDGISWMQNCLTQKSLLSVSVENWQALILRMPRIFFRKTKLQASFPTTLQQKSF